MTLVREGERDFQRTVTELAEMLGWEWMHVRPMQTKHGWATGTSGTMAKGWPDLTLVRERDHRLLFVELKAEDGVPTPAQDRVLALLRTLHWAADDGNPSTTTVEVYVWWPRDFDDIAKALR
jgi:hypothetical protein